MREEFDQFASSYEADLSKGLSVTGEDKDYFARMRVEWLAKLFDDMGVRCPKSILDYGCGDGGSIRFLSDAFSPVRLIGVDPSSESLNIAKHLETIDGVEFKPLHLFAPENEFDLVFTNGVFHHIPPAERSEAFQFAYKALKVGGYFAFWENNPWNLGTRYVMSRIPFDRDAKMVFPAEALRGMRKTKFLIERKDFLFIFPGPLKKLRVVEPFLSRFPFGGQYLIVARKDSA